jgi:hypothetical protein
MSYTNRGRTIGRRLLLPLLSAAVLVHAGDTLAGDLVGDAQTRARNLLSGNRADDPVKNERSIARSEVGDPAFDTLAHARQVLSGKPNYGPTAVLHAVATRSLQARGPHSRGADAQEMVRSLILGKVG